MSYNPIFDAMRQAREDANAAHRRIDEDTEDSAEFLFGMGLFVGVFVVVFACIAVECGGWFLWVAAAVFAIVSGLMIFAACSLFKGALSQRVHSLWNSARASERQVRDLRNKAATLLRDRQARMAALDEARLHREAASRKKRELAILAAQEIADLSHLWGNAVVAVEDLGWISNTMQNGRWNRGELVKWLTHYVTQNGGWVVAVSPANTSQLCHKCGQRVTHPTRKVSVCPEHGAMDRDVNAAANIAARAVPRVAKARATRAKNRKLRPQAPLRTPPARDSLKYPGRDRTKNKPTLKRKNHRLVSGEVILPSCPARPQAQRLEAMVLADQGACDALGTNVAALKRGNATYECRLCSLI